MDTLSPFEIVLNVKPRGKGRPRFSRRNGRTYTPEATAAAEAEIRWLLLQAKAPMFEGGVILEVIATFLKPKSAKRRTLHTTRPDGSNVLKLVEDSANGILWRDDSQIISATVIKLYGNHDSITLRVRGATEKDLHTLQKEKVDVRIQQAAAV